MFKIFTLCLALALQVSISPAQAVSVDQNRKFTSDELTADLDFFLRTAKEAHFDPFSVTNEAEMTKLVDSAKAEVRRRGGMTQKEFWLVFGPLVSAIGDSHSYVVDPRFFIKDDPTRYFPIFTEYVDGKIVVSRSYTDEQVKPGAIIERINGITSKELVRRLSAHSFGNERERAVKAIKWLWVGAAEVFGRPELFEVDLADGRKVKLNGILLPDLIKRQQAAMPGAVTKPAEVSPLELKFLEAGVAYLNARTFDHDLEKYKLLLTEHFTKIKETGARALIIDVRNNSGGNSALGDALIGMFNSKPYRGYSMKWKRSDQYVAEMYRKKAPLPEIYLNLRPSEIYSTEGSMKSQSVNPLRFPGPVFILSSRETFSSGQMFLAIVKDNKLATIIGEETDAPVCNFGEIFFFNLPNSLLRMSLSVKQWVPPAGCNGTRGVIPDILINRHIDDYLAGRDAILESALAKIRGKK